MIDGPFGELNQWVSFERATAKLTERINLCSWQLTKRCRIKQHQELVYGRAFQRKFQRYKTQITNQNRSTQTINFTGLTQLYTAVISCTYGSVRRTVRVRAYRVYMRLQHGHSNQRCQLWTSRHTAQPRGREARSVTSCSRGVHLALRGQPTCRALSPSMMEVGAAA